MPANPLERLARLQALGADPPAQAAHARELLGRERNAQVVQAALAVLAEHPSHDLRPILLSRYAHYDADSVARDPGAYLRAAILRVLRHHVEPSDIALLERAAQTYEFLPPTRSEEAWPLRAAALIALDELDAELAGYHAVRLLADRYTAPMSGEPAVTAAQLLAAHGQLLPLYQYAVRAADGATYQPDLLAECLKQLTRAPRSVLLALVEAYRESADEIVLVGLFDLIVGHRDYRDCIGFLGDFLRATRHYHAYHYLLMLLVASHKPDLLAMPVALAHAEHDPRKRQLLAEALELRRGDPAVDAALAALAGRDLPGGKPQPAQS